MIAKYISLFLHFNSFHIGVQPINNVVIVPGAQQGNSDVHTHAAPWKRVETGGEWLNICWLKISRICNYLWKVLSVSVLGTISEISIL